MGKYDSVIFPAYVTITEGDSKAGTCEECRNCQGTYLVESAVDLECIDLPPYHPNCVCEVEIEESGEREMCTEYGNEREMQALILKAKNIFWVLCDRFKTKGGLHVIPNWWLSRIPGIGTPNDPDLACKARAQLLMNEFNSNIPDNGWHAFSHVRGYFPNVGKFGFSHSWIELDLKYKDKFGVDHAVKMKFDPYNKTVEFHEPQSSSGIDESL